MKSVYVVPYLDGYMVAKKGLIWGYNAIFRDKYLFPIVYKEMGDAVKAFEEWRNIRDKIKQKKLFGPRIIGDLE